MYVERYIYEINLFAYIYLVRHCFVLFQGLEGHIRFDLFCLICCLLLFFYTCFLFVHQHVCFPNACSRFGGLEVLKPFGFARFGELEVPEPLCL